MFPAGAPIRSSRTTRTKSLAVVAASENARAEERTVGAGSVIYVEAGLEHRFFDVEEELVVLVVFAPEENS
jgi:mannose-6-phosphate isomerase-like protein (cupin superfamily)